MEALIEEKLAEVLRVTKTPFEATMVADRVAVAFEVAKGVNAVGYITPNVFSDMMTQGRLLADVNFNQKYGPLLRTKVLENYQRVVEFILEHTQVKSRRGKRHTLPSSDS